MNLFCALLVVRRRKGGSYWFDRILILNFRVGETSIFLYVNGQNNRDGKINGMGKRWAIDGNLEFTQQREIAEHWWNDLI